MKGGEVERTFRKLRPADRLFTKGVYVCTCSKDISEWDRPLEQASEVFLVATGKNL